MKKLFDPLKFGKTLEEALTATQLTVREAAELIGCSHATISRVCNGGRPSIENFIRICKWLDKVEIE